MHNFYFDAKIPSLWNNYGIMEFLLSWTHDVVPMKNVLLLKQKTNQQIF